MKRFRKLICLILSITMLLSGNIVVFAEDGDGGTGGTEITGGSLLPIDSSNPVNCGQIHQPRPIRKAFRFSHWSELMDWSVLKTAF